MSSVSRSATYTADTIIQPGIHNTEHDDFVSGINDNDTRVTNIESANMSISGIKTCTDYWVFVSGLRTNTISERTTGNGVAVDGVTLKDGCLYLGEIADQTAEDALTLADGMMWYRADTDTHRVRQNGATKTLSTGSTSTDTSARWIHPAFKPAYRNATTVTLPAGLSAMDKDGVSVITLSANVTLDLTSTGAGKLDTGSRTSSTPYYVYLIQDSDGVLPDSAVASAEVDQSTGPTMPAGYDRWRRLNWATITDGSNNLLPSDIVGGWPYNTRVMYDATMTTYNAGFVVGGTNVLAVGTASSFTDVNCAAFVPANSQSVILQVMTDHQGTGTSYYQVRKNGATNNGQSRVASGVELTHMEVPTDADQVIEYRKLFDTGGGSDRIYLDVVGFTVTEVS